MKNIKLLSALMLMMLVMLFTGCNKQEVPVVSTVQPSEITATSCIAGGVITSNGGDDVVERGVCWSTNPQPVISDHHLTAGSGIGSFSCEITNLTAGTTYYVRAYALNNAGVGYGEALSFTTLDPVPELPEGAIGGRFSVSPTQQVYFSKGNLQFLYFSQTWQFPQNQWDCVDNLATEVICYFGWATSGWNVGNAYYQPWDFDLNNPSFYGPSEHDLTGEYVNCDWGSNPILNGGGQPHQWRTLTESEWRYLFSRNTNSGMVAVLATLNGVNGIIVLPDDWDVSYYPLNPGNANGYGTNIIDASQWGLLEQYGAVFLPAAGYRSGNLIYGTGEVGGYWSASYSDATHAVSPYFNITGFDIIPAERSFGLSVRLVQDVR